MTLMIESCTKIHLYKIYCINKHVPCHVDDKVFKADHTKFSVHFNQEFNLCNITFRQQNVQNVSQNHNHIVVNLDILISVHSVFLISLSHSFLASFTFYIWSSWLELQHHTNTFINYLVGIGIVWRIFWDKNDDLFCCHGACI